MDFFKSVFSDDPESSLPHKSENPSSESPINPSEEELEEEELEERDSDQQLQFTSQNPNPNPNFSSSSWSFGGLIKTFATKSESVLQTYRRDLEEFSSGLKKETSVIRDVATRAVKDLPISLETGASVAQESLESVGQAIDDFGSSVWRGTAEIISQGKDAILSPDQDSDSSDAQNFISLNLNSKRYSRFETQVVGIQSDMNTYCEDPEDLDDFNKWKLRFLIEEKGEEIMSICSENVAVEGMFSKLVPNVVDYEMFWTRYFYRIHKLKQVEDARVNLVKRAISREDEEELSWEVDDDDEETNLTENRELEKEDNVEASKLLMEKNPIDGLQVESSEVVAETGEKSSDSKTSEMGSAIEPATNKESDGRVMLEGKAYFDESNSDESVAKSDEKMFLEGKTDHAESCKDSDFSVVSSQPSVQEDDDLGWDEIEDLGSGDEKKVTAGGSPSRVDLRKRLSAADEDEDLGWDIEDDEPVKQ
ncbi:uncharacterized protein LOC143852926 [Tasmannia lanceolata]|uniref:uncharacterized protein LOC143852926 n=1 Tax=Tasmannia lanceolata TaxID=3420 RepID=UPI0040629EC2